jgi:hypothetical protein
MRRAFCLSVSMRVNSLLNRNTLSGTSKFLPQQEGKKTLTQRAQRQFKPADTEPTPNGCAFLSVFSVLKVLKGIALLLSAR